MTELPWASMALVGGAFLAVFAAGEIAHRRLGLRAEASRKLVHAAAGVVALPLPAIFASAWPVVILSSAFFVFLVITRRTGHLSSVHGIGRASAGAFLYPVAIAATFVLAHERASWYAVAVAALAFADAASGIVGDRVGRRRYAAWGQLKSVEGSAAAFLVTAVTTAPILLVAGTAPAPATSLAIVVGIVVAMVEGALPWGLDNLGVPLAALAALAAIDALPGPAGVGLVLVGAVVLLRLATLRSRSAEPRPALAPSDAR